MQYKLISKKNKHVFSTLMSWQLHSGAHKKLDCWSAAAEKSSPALHAARAVWSNIIPLLQEKKKPFTSPTASKTAPRCKNQEQTQAPNKEGNRR